MKECQRVAMEVIGNSTIAMTQNIYTHVFDEAERQTAYVMDQLLD